MQRHRNRSRFIRVPVIAQSTLDAYLKRPFDDFDFLKQVPKAELVAELYALGHRFVTEPRINQLVATLIGTHQPAFLFFKDMGSGKSKLLIDLIRYRKKRGELQRALIIVPYLLHVDSWAYQFREHGPDLKYTLLLGNKNDRMKLLDEKSDVCVINHAGLEVYMAQAARGKSRIVADLAADFAVRFNFMAIDESHRLGNHNSLLWKLCSWLSTQCEYRYAATGTPFGRDPIKLWPQFRLIDQGETFGMSITLFRMVFFKAVKDYWAGVKWEFNHAMEGELHRVMRHRSITYTEKELTDTPPMVRIRLPVRLTSEGADYYKRIIDKIIEARGDFRSLKHPFLRMRQVSSGFLSLKADDDSRVQVQFKVNPKLDALRQFLIDKPEAEKLLLYYQYTPSGKWIAEMLKEMKIPFAWLWGGAKDAPGEYRRFLEDPKCRIFLLQNDLGSENINPQYVCHYGAVYESPVDPIKRQQLEKRLKRPGQKHITFLYDFVVQGTIEEKILTYVQEGKDLLRAILEGEESFEVEEDDQQEQLALPIE